MRALVQPDVLRKAFAAAFISALVAWPRLAGFKESPNPQWFLVLVALWAAFCMWAAVFAWHERYSGRKIFSGDRSAKFWGAITLASIAAAFALHFAIDPIWRHLLPRDFPTTISAWAAQTLFYLGFEQLFFYFAPLALFERLGVPPSIAIVTTVLWNLFTLWLRLDLFHAAPSTGEFILLIAARAAMTVFIATAFLRAGVPAALWIGLLLHLRSSLAMKDAL
jgi:hypothetical protein